MKKLRTVSLAVMFTAAIGFGAGSVHAATTSTTPGTTGTMTSGYTGTATTSPAPYLGTDGKYGTSAVTGTGTTTPSAYYTGSNYDATTGTGYSAPTGTGNYYNYSTTGVKGYGNNMMDRMSTTGTGIKNAGTGYYDNTSYRAYGTATTNRMDWGWLGLVGLIGLAGLRGGNRDKTHS